MCSSDLFKVAQLRMVYCAKTEDEAWAQCQHHLFHLFDFYAEILKEANDAEGDDVPLPITKAEDIRHSPLAEELMIGTPEQVARKMEKFAKKYVCTDFIMDSQFPGLDPKLGTRSMELFAKEVMPAFR